MSAMMESEAVEPAAAGNLRLRDLERSKNVDALLSAERSGEIGSAVVEAFEQDKGSRKEWETRMEAAIKLALQMVEAKSHPWPGAANIKFPLVTIAALQFAARAYPALVKAPDLVKYRVMGEDPDGAKAARAARISRHMSFQMLDQDEQWEEDTDRKFIVLPIIGCAFKKTYFDAVSERNTSRLVLPQNLVVHYYTRSIEECERKTEVFELYDRQIKERQLKGVYSEKELGLPVAGTQKLSDQRQGIAPPPQSKHTPRELLEQHTYLDLDDDGYPEPYIVTVDRASRKVLRIVARFAEVETEQSLKIKALTDQKKLIGAEAQAIVEQIKAAAQQSLPEMADMPPEMAQQQMQMAMQAAHQHIAEQTAPFAAAIQQLDAQISQLQAENEANPRVLRIAPLECYTKFGFIPSPDGGFYDLGLGALLGPVNDSVNTLINQLIDSGTLQNGSQGFIGKGARIQGGEVKFKPFEWKRVNVAGQTLKESIVPLPVNQPSTVLYQLLSLLISYGEKIASVNDAMMGKDMGQNTPAYNMQAMLEQGLQVFNAIFKRLYRSFRKELRKLYVLNRLYLNPVEYFETLDGRHQALQNDYAGDARDVLPAADPNAFSNSEHLMQAQFLASRAVSVAGYDPVKVERRLLMAMNVPDMQEVFPLDEQGAPKIPPPRNPEFEIQAAEEQRRTLESQSRTEINAAVAQADIALKELQGMKLLADIDQGGAKVQIDEFNAITDRIRAANDRVKAVADANRKKSEARAD